MCYVDDPDERVEEAVEEMLEEYKWLEDSKVFSHFFNIRWDSKSPSALRTIRKILRGFKSAVAASLKRPAPSISLYPA
jgi:hypothetical protein